MIDLREWAKWSEGRDLRVAEEPTTQECLDGCSANQRDAEWKLKGCEDRLRYLDPSLERQNAKHELARWRAEALHWAGYVEYFKGRLAYEDRLLAAGLAAQQARELEEVPF